MNRTMNETVPKPSLYCGEGLQNFQKTYNHIHGYASLLVCLFGSLANILNIAVLTRREMTSPTNTILTGLAVADLLVMLEYIPFACHQYLPHGRRRPFKDRYSYGWTWFVLFHSNFAQVCHTISIWLTVTLAVWRYIAIAHPQHNREWCRMETTLVAIACAYVISPLLCIPFYIAFSIKTGEILVDSEGRTESNLSYVNEPGYHKETYYVVNLSELGSAQDSLLFNINFWMYSVVIKIIPCVALSVLSLRLICALLETKRRRQNLTSISTTPSGSTDEGTKMLKKSSRMMEKDRQTDRTTRMLLAVLLLFLITEFPQGILGLLSGILGNAFFKNCYMRLGEVMDILALINSAINFILYCAMSRQFRTTFSLMFKPKILNRWLPVSQANGNTDNNGATVNNMTQVTQV
ncbi:G-protein coupled receptor dmsr-1-like [Anabrus simplex]|uniref:G-protein coupled receptor dmsr-1-like n=1 Tax=Anabrus simplex TaxID=316456 RepID=UPI0034DD7C6A